MAGFNDGLAAIYRVENQAAPGDKPVECLVRKGVLRYRRRTVGIQRHYAALNAGARTFCCGSPTGRRYHLRTWRCLRRTGSSTGSRWYRCRRT